MPSKKPRNVVKPTRAPPAPRRSVAGDASPLSEHGPGSPLVPSSPVIRQPSPEPPQASSSRRGPQQINVGSPAPRQRPANDP